MVCIDDSMYMIIVMHFNKVQNYVHRSLNVNYKRHVNIKAQLYTAIHGRNIEHSLRYNVTI